MFHLIELFLFHVHMFLLKQLIAFFHHHHQLNAILLISSVKTLQLSLLKLSCIFNIDLLRILYDFFKTMYVNFTFFLDISFYYHVELFLNSFYTFQI